MMKHSKTDSITHLNPKEIIEAFHKADLVLRSVILYMHPDDAQALRSAAPDILERCVIKESQLIEKGKIICAQRDKIESEFLIRT